MKGKFRVLAVILSLALLFTATAAQSEGAPLSPAARLRVSVNALKPTGEMGFYGPAIPVSDSPDENRLWLQVPLDVFFTGRMSLLIEDSMHEYLSFQPENGTEMDNISDVGERLDYPSVSITYYDITGDPAGVCYLYISSQTAPATEESSFIPSPEEIPTEAPVEQPTEAPAVPLAVTVRYLDKDGNSIAEDTVQPLAPGSNNVYPSADVPDGYELTELGVKEVFADASGVNPPVVEFHYALKEISVSVKINYVDQDGNPLMESTVYNFDSGEHPVFSLPIEGYTVVEPSLQTVLVDRDGANPAEITFVYEHEVQPVNVTIHYVDMNGEPLRKDDVLAFSKGIHNALAVVIPDYTLINEAEQPVLVDENGADPAEITFVYQQEIHPTDILIHYLDENGEPIAPDAAQTLFAASNVVAPAEDAVPEDYELTSSGAVEVKLDGDGAHPAEVTFRYRRIIKAANVTLHYVDDLGNPIAKDSVVSCPAGDSVVTPRAEIDLSLYTLTEPFSYPVTVTLEGASKKEFTFTYQRIAQPVKVIVRYVDERGEAIVPNSEALFQPGVHQVRPMADISSKDYILTGPEFYPLTVTLDGASANEFTFTYQRVVKPVQVTVHYLNEDGEPVAEDTFQTLTGGANVVFPQAAPKGYALPDDAEPFKTVTVDADGAHPAEVSFVYQVRTIEPATIPVRFIDQDSGVEIALSRTVTVQPGSAVEVSALPAPEDLLPGYLLVSEPAVTVQVNEDGVSSVKEIVFSYLYKPQPTGTPEAAPSEAPAETPAQAPTAEPAGIPTLEPALEPTQEPAEVPTEEPAKAQPVTVTVRYLDTEGNPVAQDGQVRCNVGDTVINAAPVDLPEGYVAEEPQSVLVHVDENGADPDEIIFTYRYISEAPAPKVALVNVKYTAPDGSVFYSYPTTCVEGQENPVYINWEYVDSSLDYALATPDTVYVTVNHSGAAEPAEVEFRFKEEMSAAVWVYYRDMVTGQNVASPYEKQCYPGANTVDASPVNLEPGYTLSSPASVTVTLSQEGELTPNEVVFQYWREVTEAPAATTAPDTEPMDAYFYPTGPSVNVRSSMSTADSNNILGIVNSADLGRVLGKTVTGDGKVWYTVEITGITGYMSDTVVRFLNEAEIMALFNYTPVPTAVPTPVPTEVPIGAAIDRWGQTNAKVNFRRTPEKNGARISEVHKNERVWIYSSEDTRGETWYSVCYKGANGYLMADYVDILSEAESEKIQASLASPVPTQIPPATPVPTEAPTPEPTPEPTEEPTREPTEAPTPEPTEEPTPEPTEAPVETLPPLPTETPVPYRGYALTAAQTDLRFDVDLTNNDVLQNLPAQTLVEVKAETTVDGVSWAHAQVVGSENVGYIPMSSLIPISNDEARIYRDQISTTPEVTASPSPEQVEGYAMTLGDGVPMRNYPDTNGEIITLLPYTAVAYIFSQQYTDAAWHVVQYNGMWGYIRQDQLRLMSAEEVIAYEESMIDASPSPSPAPTPEPITQTSLSSYGYVMSNSGKVNLRSGPSVSSTALRLLDNYVFALALGTETNDEGIWYHVNQAGTDGYIRSDYFHVIPLAELNSFLQSDEYINANSVTTADTVTSSQIQSVEDYNRNVWKNPALMASYEPFNPFVTSTPGADAAAPTNTPAPTDTPAPTATTQIAPVSPTGGNLPEPNVKQGGAPWPWFLLGLAVVGGGGAYYAYTVHSQNKKRAELRAQQARQARTQAAAHPQMRAAQNNPVQPAANQPAGRAGQPVNPSASRAAQPVNKAAQAEIRSSLTANRPAPVSHQENLAYLPPKSAAQKTNQAAASLKPLPSVNRPSAVSGDTRTYPAKLSQEHTQVYQTRKPAPAQEQPLSDTASWKPAAKPEQAQASAVTSAPAAAPEQPAAQTDASVAPRQRVRRTERHKDLYNQNDKA